MNKFVCLSIVLLAIYSGVVAQAEEWKSSGPVASGDMTALVDYQVKRSIPAGDVWKGRTPQGPSSFESLADPLWVNVRRDGLSTGDRVFVQIISYEQYCNRGQCYEQQKIVEKDLQFAEPGRFSVQMEPLRLNYQLNDGYALTRATPHSHDIVVWINGRLYKDAQGRNLQIKMNDVVSQSEKSPRIEDLDERAARRSGELTGEGREESSELRRAREAAHRGSVR